MSSPMIDRSAFFRPFFSPRLAVLLAAGWVLQTVAFAAQKPTDQPGLVEAFNSAQEIPFEPLADGPDTCWVGPQMWVQNPDGKTWDVVMWYYRSYGGPHQIVARDFGTGETKRFDVPEKSRSQFNGASYFVIGGKLYMQAWGYNVNYYVYDPADNSFSEHLNLFQGEVDGTGVVRSNPDASILYGFGISGKKDRQPRVTFYKVAIPSLEPEIIGTVDTVLEHPFDYYDEIAVDGDWLYAIVGQKPWRLFAMNITSREGKVLAESEPIAGDHRTMNLRTFLEYPGALFTARNLKGTPIAAGESKFFWLRNGELKPTGDPGKKPVPPWAEEAYPQPLPWFGRSMDREKKFLPPGMKWQRSPIDLEGKVRCFYRFTDAELAAACKSPADKWLHFDLDIQLYPAAIRHMAVLPDKSIYAQAESYARATRFWPESGKREMLGPTLSTHTLCWHEGRLYMSGYPLTQIWAYDPDAPWTVGRASPEPPPETDDEADEDEGQEGAKPGAVGPNSNPAKVGELMKFTKAHYSWGGANPAADGRIYYGCKIYRIGDGGALGWWDTVKQEAGGFFEPFSAYAVYWSCTADNGRYVVLSTKPVEDDAKPGYHPERGRLFVYDTSKHELIHQFEDERLGIPGFVIEGTPGIVIGYTRGGNSDPSNPGLLYGFDVAAGKILWTKAVPRSPETGFSAMRRARITYTKGPDGMIWANMGGVLTRIDPANADIQVVGATPENQIVFLGGKVYCAGAEKYRTYVLPEAINAVLAGKK